MGKREFRQMLTAIFRASGQVSGGPSSESVQDFARMRAPISPPPARKWGRAIPSRPLSASFGRDPFGIELPTQAIDLAIIFLWGAQTGSHSRRALVLVQQPAKPVTSSYFDRFTDRVRLD